MSGALAGGGKQGGSSPSVSVKSLSSKGNPNQEQDNWGGDSQRAPTALNEVHPSLPRLTFLGTGESGRCIVADQFEELQREKQAPEE